MPTYSKAIMQQAQALARLQTKRRRLRQELKRLDAEIRTEKKQLQKVINAYAVSAWQESGAASKVFDTEGGQ